MQAKGDRIDTINKTTRADAFCAAYRHKQRPPIHELDVVVALCLIRHTFADHNILDCVERIAPGRALTVPKPYLG